ncbi:type II toxin-antitoxin system VapC family toxin [Hymenobacter weizhouensis]|uniref:type II toxin-antitoxin system VapC family toxin n=1 Tax=Hymenobacter sp. YIM 151500-1 TaxID=2987689 RepID=UPI00222801E8|nr:type II toxin-antitoxin system VapC family toxin [Hymenobacter sp. YIM 151500-1]UYZ63833.1 type II toxin-antitoxin system VapC family toxin [Hymenobacter sp. YIM 151500-1]
MRILLDTHMLLWYQSNNPQLSASASALLLDTNNTLLVSAATWWEMAIKISSHKLAIDLSTSMAAATRRGIDTLPLQPAHFLRVASLAYPDENHRDPFDRLIIAQALTENIPVLTAGDKFDLYVGLQRFS